MLLFIINGETGLPKYLPLKNEGVYLRGGANLFEASSYICNTWPEMRDSQRNVLRAQKFAKFWSVSIIQPDIKSISSELRS